jgi:prepilin-type processing-associated H-X9-DG protein/prepilin-type N-terminal cleavage/methylation domain-containing protein
VNTLAHRNSYCPRFAAFRAFSLIELLIVTAVILVLLSLLLPALASSRSASRSLVCLSNVRQLQLALKLYADDERDEVVPNNSTNENLVLRSLPGSWVLGNAQRDKDPATITNGLLFPYASASLGIFRCPGDTSMVHDSSSSRLRSYALSGLGRSGYAAYGLVSHAEKLLLSGVRNPADVFSFLEEHPDSIDDGIYVSQSMRGPSLNPNPPTWFELPADRHNRGANLSFLDGHVEHHPWLAPKRFLHYAQAPLNSADERDLAWQAQRRRGSY